MYKYKTEEYYCTPDAEDIQEDCKGGWRLVCIIVIRDGTRYVGYFEKVTRKNVKS